MFSFRHILVAVAATTLSTAALAAPSNATFAYSGGGVVTLTLNNSYVLTATNTGWYESVVGDHNGGNSNYIAGICGSSDVCGGSNNDHHNFFVFDLAGYSGGAITSATLAIAQPSPDGYISAAPSITYTNWDVTTSIADLISTTSNLATYADLGSGINYASTTILPSSIGTDVLVSLNGAALASLNSAIGGGWAVGGAVAAIPEPASWAMMVLGFGLAGAAMRRRQSVVVTA